MTGESCTDPVITPSAYTTSDAVISSESVFIVELSLTCANGAQVTRYLQQSNHVLYLMSRSDWTAPHNACPLQSVTLYADVNGRQFPVTRGQDVGKYQVLPTFSSVSIQQPLLLFGQEQQSKFLWGQCALLTLLKESSPPYYRRLSSLPLFVFVLLFNLVPVMPSSPWPYSNLQHYTETLHSLLEESVGFEFTQSWKSQHVTSSCRYPGAFLTNRPALEHIRSNSLMKSPTVPCARLVFDATEPCLFHRVVSF